MLECTETAQTQHTTQQPRVHKHTLSCGNDNTLLHGETSWLGLNKIQKNELFFRLIYYALYSITVTKTETMGVDALEDNSCNITVLPTNLYWESNAFKKQDIRASLHYLCVQKLESHQLGNILNQPAILGPVLQKVDNRVSFI